MGTILVGEIGINHNGDVELAKKLASIAGLADLDYVKFQKRDVDTVYTKEYLDSPRESPWGTTQREQKEGLEFGKDEYGELNGFIRLNTPLAGWFASPWDTKSVEFLEDFDCHYTKVASASITDFELLEAIKGTGRPVIISTGMSTKKEVDACINLLGDQVEYILACNSTYPTKDKDMNMRFIKTLKDEYPTKKIGFSNHNSGIIFCMVAVALGAEMVEFHVTVDRAMYGSDQAASLETGGVLRLGEHARAIEVGMGSDEWIVTPEEEKIKRKLRK